MPIMESENVTNTLIEYMTSKAETAPELAHRAARLLRPMSMIPFWEESRSDKLPNQCGTQESCAMLARHLGPPIKPAWAATTSNVASESTVIQRNACARGPGRMLFANHPASKSFIVRPVRTF